MRSLDETRTIALLNDTIRAAGHQAAPPREHTLADGKKMREDAHIPGSPYGIAYVTQNEAKALGKALPAYQPDSSQLRLIRPSQEAVVLVLYADAYRYDIGETHATNATTAENRLKRDVSDFLHHVVKTGKHR